MQKYYDIVIIGGGIVGLTLALELVQRRAGSIAIFEKEPTLGVHASGRNSGVLHAGIYYPEQSLKSAYCRTGHDRMLKFVESEGLPILKCGKVVISTTEENLPGLDLLQKRADSSGAKVQRITRAELRELEPCAAGVGDALWVPQTSVIDSPAVLERIRQRLVEGGVTFHLGERFESVDVSQKTMVTSGGTYGYGFFVNAAGTFADRIAHKFDVGHEYRILPFKGLYFGAAKEFSGKVKRLIYPVPDIRMPFLGVHVTLTTSGKTLFGPTAIPAFGRENYGLLQGIEAGDGAAITTSLAKMLFQNRDGFRSYVASEMGRYLRPKFYAEARRLVNDLRPSDIGGLYKVGIRAQLLNQKLGKLEMDFVIRKEGNSLHILNAISPAFTSSMGFAPDLANQVLGVS